MSARKIGILLVVIEKPRGRDVSSNSPIRPERLLFLVRFRRHLGRCCRSSAFHYFEPCHISYDPVSEPFSLRVYQIRHDLLVSLIICRKLVRISRNELPRYLLDSGYPNFSHSSTSEKRGNRRLVY